MTEEIIIDVSNCPHKSEDDCMEAPICNEYGDLMGYQNCEAQTLCPYRSQKKIERLEQLKNKYYQQTLDDEITISDLITKCNDLEQENKELKEEIQFHSKENSNLLAERNALQIGYDEIREVRERYRSALEKIKDLCIHYKNTNDKCITNCYAHFIVTDLIQNKINEVLQ